MLLNDLLAYKSKNCYTSNIHKTVKMAQWEGAEFSLLDSSLIISGGGDKG